jgi:hypothetical protein
MRDLAAHPTFVVLDQSGPSPRRTIRTMASRARWIVAAVVLGGTVGLVISLARPTSCIGGGGDGFDAVFACSYKSLLLWDAAPIVADAGSALLGAVLGGIVGWVSFRVRARRLVVRVRDQSL